MTSITTPVRDGLQILTQKLGGGLPFTVIESTTMAKIINPLFRRHQVRPARDFGGIGELETETKLTALYLGVAIFVS